MTAQAIQIKERPILFSGEMVKAILENRKTQTRRVMKPPVPQTGLDEAHLREAVRNGYVVSPYGKPGDHLWVRETFQKYGDGYAYRATPAIPENNNWKPSIFMPRWASRITLEITNVRVERLNDISWRDAAQEGVDAWGERSCPGCSDDWGCGQPRSIGGGEIGCSVFVRGYVEEFRRLWDTINGKKHPWSSNPWVWVVEFKKI